MESLGLSGIVLALSGCFSMSILWSLFLLPMRMFGLSLYFVDDERQLQALKRIVAKSSSIVNNDEAFGWIFGKWYVGYIYQSGDRWQKSQMCYLIARKILIDEIKPQPVQLNTSAEPVFVQLYDRCGNYDYIYYTDRKLNVTDFMARPQQEKAICFIESYYKVQKFATVLLSGPPNCGKSVIALLLAKHFSGSLVYEFNPTEPGNSINNLYNKVNPSFNAPLIITFEEVDGMIEAIHHGKVTRHDTKPISIYNKATWNTFLDNIDHRFYPHVIFLFTTNRCLSWFEDLDPSYMRNGRVNVKIAMTASSCELVYDANSCQDNQDNLSGESPLTAMDDKAKKA